jgi:poly(hydroxyalkanoate) depolymerase family esterase
MAKRHHHAGLSAGGAMTAVMLAVEPDVFSAGAVFAGVPYNCGTGIAAAFSCMNPGVTKTQAQWAALVDNATDFAGTWPRVLVVHGSSDTTVAGRQVYSPSGSSGIIRCFTVFRALVWYSSRDFRISSST